MVASLAGHTHAFKDARRIGTSAYRTGGTQTVVLTVSQITNTAKTVTGNDTLETVTFGGSYCVDEFAFLEDINCQNFTIFLLVTLFETAEFSNITFGGGVGLCKMATHSLSGAAFFLLTKGQLNCRVSILFDGFHLCHNTRTSFNHCARNLLSVGIKKTGHSDFLS